MHILISSVSSARYPSGICRHAANLAVALGKMREVTRVSLLVGSWQREYFDTAFHLRGSGVDLVSVFVENSGRSRNMWYYRLLSQAATALAADLVHLSFPVPISRRSFSCPVVCTVHDLYPYDIPANFAAGRVIFNRMFLRRCLAQSDFVVCSSDYTLERLRACFPALSAAKTGRIYPVVALNAESLEESAAPQLTSRPFLLAVAQHRRNKNLRLLIEAFAKLRRNKAAYGELKLVIVGAEGPETKRLEALVRRYSLAEHVTFMRQLADEELGWLYRNCEGVVVSSSIEGFCLPVAEGRQCGARIVCSDIPVLREVGSAACRYFQLSAADPAAELAAAVDLALRASKPDAQTDHRFTPHNIARQHIALYRALIVVSESRVAASLEAHDGVPQQYAV